MRWKRSATVAMAMVSLTATVSHAQSTTFMTSNSDWTSLIGCHITPGPFTLPGGIVYYSPNTFPAAGAAMLGICGPIPKNVPPPTFGWGGPTTPPDFGTGGGGGGGSVDQFFTPQNEQGDNNQGDWNDQGDNDQGDNDQGNQNDGPHFVPTNDGPPNNSEIPQNNAALDTTSTPEPSSVILLGSGLIGLGAREMRRRKHATSPEK